LIFHFTASSYGIGIETISFIFVGGVIGKEKVLLGGDWQVLWRGRVEASLMTPINSFVDAAHTNEPSDQRSEDLKEPEASSPTSVHIKKSLLEGIHTSQTDNM